MHCSYWEYARAVEYGAQPLIRLCLCKPNHAHINAIQVKNRLGGNVRIILSGRPSQSLCSTHNQHTHTINNTNTRSITGQEPPWWQRAHHSQWRRAPGTPRGGVSARCHVRASGAGEVGMGFEVSPMALMRGTVRIIICRRTTHLLFQLIWQATGASVATA